MISTVAQALAHAREQGLDRLDAQVLLASAVQRPRTWVLAHGEAPLAADAAHAFKLAVARRADGEPLAYIVGEKEFHGLALRVTAHVLVPRPDTETLVDWAVQLLGGELSATPRPQVADLGTGSGAIALALKNACRHADVIATDVSAQALALAQDNAHRLRLDVQWRLGDWWAAVGDRRFHLALSNPPYIAQHDPHLAALRHEPALALTSGPDGLAAIRHIVGHAASHLEPGAWLLIEHGHDQAAAVKRLLTDAGFSGVESRADLAGVWRCSGGRCAISRTPSPE